MTTSTIKNPAASGGTQTEQHQPYEVGTTVHVAPDTLLTTKNIREVNLDKEFVASIAELGVLVPIVAVLTTEGTALLVRFGHRRTHGAVQAERETVPVYIAGVDGDAATEEILRIISQRDENTHRAGLTAADDLHVVEQLTAFGLSAAQVAKKARIKRGQVDAALAVSGSKLASKAAQRYDLDLAQLAVVAEFEDDTDTVKALVAAAMEGKFEHVAQRARDDREKARMTAEVVAMLAEGDVPVIDHPGYGDKARRLDQMRANLDAREVLTYEEHERCPGHVAWVGAAYVRVDKTGALVESPAEPEHDADEAAWDAYEAECDKIRAETREVQRPAPIYGCVDPRKHGHVAQDQYGCWPSRATSKPKADEMSEEDRAKAKKARALVIENNKAWEASHAVRREWLAEFASRKTPPKGTGALLATALCKDAAEVNDTGGNALAADWLKAKGTGGYGRTDLSPAKTVTENRATVVALVQVLGGYEASITKDSWRSDGTTNATGRFLRFIEACGYALSDVEKFAISKKRA